MEPSFVLENVPETILVDVASPSPSSSLPKSTVEVVEPSQPTQGLWASAGSLPEAVGLSQPTHELLAQTPSVGDEDEGGFLAPALQQSSLPQAETPLKIPHLGGISGSPLIPGLLDEDQLQLDLSPPRQSSPSPSLLTWVSPPRPTVLPVLDLNVAHMEVQNLKRLHAGMAPITMDQRLEEARKKMASANERVQDTRDKYIDLKGQKKAFEEQLEATSEKLAHAESKIREQEETITSLTTQIDRDLQVRLMVSDEQRRDYDEMRKRLAFAEQQYFEEKAKNKTHVEDIQRLRAAAATTASASKPAATPRSGVRGTTSTAASVGSKIPTYGRTTPAKTAKGGPSSGLADAKKPIATEQPPTTQPPQPSSAERLAKLELEANYYKSQIVDLSLSLEISMERTNKAEQLCEDLKVSLRAARNEIEQAKVEGEVALRLVEEDKPRRMRELEIELKAHHFIMRKKQPQIMTEHIAQVNELKVEVADLETLIEVIVRRLRDHEPNFKLPERRKRSQPPSSGDKEESDDGKE